MSSASHFSVGDQCIGRVIDCAGQPIDGKGPFAQSSSLPIRSLKPAEPVPSSATQQYETGMKIIDLVAPVPRGGVIAVYGEPDVGKMVVIGELILSLNRAQQGYTLCLDCNVHPYTVSVFAQMIQELGEQNSTVLLYEQAEPAADTCQRVVEAGLTLADYYRGQQRELFLVIGEQIVTNGKLLQAHALHTALRAHGITTFLLRNSGTCITQEADDVDTYLDGRLIFSRERFQQGLYPAIDPLRSSSRLLNERLVAAEQLSLAEEARTLLQHYQTPRKNLSATDQMIFQRARRLQNFLTQPFVTAELFTNIPGEYILLAETLTGTRSILAGQGDQLSEQAFYFVGTFKDALAKQASSRD